MLEFYQKCLKWTENEWLIKKSLLKIDIFLKVRFSPHRKSFFCLIKTDETFNYLFKYVYCRGKAMWIFFFCFCLSVILFVFVCRVPGLNTPRITLYGWEACVLQPLCATWAPQFWLWQASVCKSRIHAGYLHVPRPLDFCLVIQVLLHPCMILIGWAHRQYP